MNNRTDEQKEAVVPTILNMEAGRRAFLRHVGLGATGMAVLASAMGATDVAQAQAVTDTQILNFALNLEYLEAEFYLRAIGLPGLDPGDVSGVGTVGTVTGGRRVPFDDNMLVRQYAVEIALDERAHVRFLRSALGDSKVARPKLDIGPAFAAAAQQAGLGAGFDAYASENNFLLAAFIFEDVGVTAYKGAARLIQSKDILEAAAGLLAVEAYHASNIRTVLASRGLYVQAQKISDLRDSVDGATDDDQGIGTPGQTNIVPADKNGLAYSRTTSQVLKVVYLGGTSNGGFFPNGVNGSIKTAGPV